MKVWRKQTVRSRNGQRETILSKRFYGTLRTFDDKRKQIPLTEDKASSLALLKRLQRDEDDKRGRGVTRQDEQRQRPVNEHVDDYEAYLTAKGNTPQHVLETISDCRKLLKVTGTKTVADLDGQRILRTLSDWRSRRKNPIGVNTSNHYLTAIKSFSRWLWRSRITSDDPLAGLSRLNIETDRRRIRRPLTPAEFETLTKVTQLAKTHFGNDWRLTGTDRRMLYEIASYTGLRVRELRSLTKSSFDLTTLTWTLPASVSKNRKASTLPLSPTLAERLRTWFVTIRRETLFPGSWHEHSRAGKIFAVDLKRAGIAHVDANGHYVDFHSLRHTFITSLARAGVHPSKAQRLARHSTITLTMNVYTTLNVDELRSALDTLPPIAP